MHAPLPEDELPTRSNDSNLRDERPVPERVPEAPAEDATERASQDKKRFAGVDLPTELGTWIAPDSEPVRPARGAPPRLPGYELLGELGRGGMGVVYRARDLRLKRLVALKMILPGSHPSADDLVRFRREAEAVARLQHPNIVPIYEVGEHEGLPYFAMELCPGGSLAARVQEARLPPHEAAQLIEALASAMHHAHQRGIIHRDLKPANVLLVSGGHVSSDQADPRGTRATVAGLIPKITDFGLAKQVPGTAGASVRGSLTHTGAVMGTPNYMPPEQARGDTRAMGPAADIYSLGAILYELLTGRPPFQGTETMATLLQVLNQDPVPPARLQAGTPLDLETICLKCLEKEPEQRYASAAALADDLRRYQEGREIVARPLSSLGHLARWARRRPAVAALSLLAVLLTVGGVAGIAWQWHRADAERARAVGALAEAETQLYFNRVALAEREWLANNVGRVGTILARCPSQLRGWEWRYLDRLCHTALLDLPGNDGVDFSPDGKLLAMGAGVNVALHDAATGERQQLLSGHTARVSRVAFNPDGSRLASGSEDAMVRLWVPLTERRLPPCRGHTDAITGLAFGKLLASSAGRKVLFWDAGESKVLQELPEQMGHVAAVAVSPDGRRVASAGWDRVVKLWEVATGNELTTLRGHEDRVLAVVFSPDGRRLASAGQDRTVRLWDAETGQELRVLRGPVAPVTCLAWSRDGKLLATGGGDFIQPGELLLWDAESGRVLRGYRGHGGVVQQVAFDPEATRLAAADEQTVKVWDATTDQESRALLGSRGELGGVAVSPDGQLIAGSNDAGEVLLWDAATGRPQQVLRRHVGRVQAVAFSPDGGTLASAGDDQTVILWDVAAGRPGRTLKDHSRSVISLAFNRAGDRLASGCADGMVFLWNVATGELLGSWPGHTSLISGLAFSPDGSLLATASRDRTLRLWEVSGTILPRELRTMQGHNTPVSSVAFAPDGKRLASGAGTVGKGEIKVWDVATGAELATLHGHTARVMGVAYSRDGRRLASAGLDEVIKLWDAALDRHDRHEVLTLRGHRGPILSIAFGPEDVWLASASTDRTVRIWDAPQRP